MRLFLILVASVLTLILVVGIHEAGHALVARFFQVKIQKISIGFGPPLLRWKSKLGVEWIWGLWPLGGYVQLLNSRIAAVGSKDVSGCFDKKSIASRLLILLAGSAANLLTAWMAFVLVYSVGFNYRLPENNIVQAYSLAAKAGMQAGDIWVAVDHHPTLSWQEVGMELIRSWGKKEVKIGLRSSKTHQLKEVALDLSETHFTGREKSILSLLGITPNQVSASKMLRFPLLQAMHEAYKSMVKMISFYMTLLKQLFSGVLPFSLLLGPIGMLVASFTSLMQGMVGFTYFIANFSLALALVNLFPLPGLDGGSILYIFLEKLRGKPLSVAMEILLYQLMQVVFFLLLIQLLLNDLKHRFH